jgi:DNA-binding response OmpR family regulator
VKRDPEVSHIPIIMLTSADNADATLNGIEAGADDYIPKDRFAIDNLLTTLAAIQASKGES